MAVELRIPESGESITEVQIGSWLKSEGEYVERDEPVVEVETDKASMELPAPVGGVLSKVLKQNGESCSVGEVIAEIEEGPAPEGARKQRREEKAVAAGGQEKRHRDEETESRRDEGTKPRRHEGMREQQAARPAGGTPEQRVMPAARRLLAEHGLEADQVEATGPGGRLLKEDVERRQGIEGSRDRGIEEPGARTAPEAPAALQPETRAPVGADGRAEEAVPMTLLRRRVAERLVEAQRTAALLTTFNEIDMSTLMAFRKEQQDAFQQAYGIKLGIMSFFVKAAIDALKQFPQLNAEIRGTDVVYRNYYDIGVAVSTDRGLMVPVIRNAERLSFAELEVAIADFAARARDRRIGPDELQGGTFTISNGGVFGSLLSTPIINPPQSGILGLHAIQDRPVARDKQIVIRPMMYVALTYDHRIVDGRESVSLLKRIKECIENPARMLIEV